MKKQVRNYRSCQFLLFILLVVLPRVSFAGANQLSADGTVLFHWPANTTISYVVNPDAVSGFNTDLQKLVVVGAVNDAFRAWTGVLGASIHFSNDGATQLSAAAVDGTNVISFRDDPAHPLPTGVLARTQIASATATGLSQFSNGKVVDVKFVGQIVDADIFFNPGVTFNPIGMNGADLVSILTHEVGHLLGLDHTGVLSSIMDPFGESGNVSASRLLQSDDAVTVANMYPDASFSPLPGVISGTVTDAAGTPVKSAEVIAMSLSGGAPVAAQLTGADGKYAISGLPPGSYTVAVEPLDGPITPSNFPGFYSSGQTNFATTVLGGAASPSVITVSSGQTSSANVTVLAAPSNLLNGNLMAAGPQGQTSGLIASITPLYLPRGKAYTVFLSGSSGSGTNALGSDTTLSFSAPSSDITTQGPTSGTQLRQQNISVSATAAIGPSNLTVSNATSRSIMPGAIVVTVNPSVNASLDGAGFGRTLAPGAIFSIFGTDLAFGRGASGTESAAATPLPTSMGGVSVKVGDRFAPLFFVSPNQINAMVPFEVSGASANVSVVTGPLAAGNTTTVNLSPSSPGIFSTNSSGAGQGAILNGADNSFAATADSIPGAATHPAKPGDVIVIFASGLGPISPALPSGVAAGANGTPIPTLASSPQVKIGGQTLPAANIQFAGLAPGFVGLYQVNVQLPANIATGNAVPVQIVTAQGQSSNTVTIAVNP